MLRTVLKKQTPILLFNIHAAKIWVALFKSQQKLATPKLTGIPSVKPEGGAMGVAKLYWGGALVLRWYTCITIIWHLYIKFILTYIHSVSVFTFLHLFFFLKVFTFRLLSKCEKSSWDFHILRSTHAQTGSEWEYPPVSFAWIKYDFTVKRKISW